MRGGLAQSATHSGGLEREGGAKAQKSSSGGQAAASAQGSRPASLLTYGGEGLHIKVAMEGALAAAKAWVEAAHLGVGAVECGQSALKAERAGRGAQKRLRGQRGLLLLCWLQQLLLLECEAGEGAARSVFLQSRRPKVRFGG